MRSGIVGPEIGIGCSSPIDRKINSPSTLSKTKDVCSGNKRANRGIGLRNLSREISLTPIGISNGNGVNSSGEVLNVLGRSAVVPYIGIGSNATKDRKVNGSGILSKTKDIGIHRKHGKCSGGLSNVSGIGSHTTYGIGNGIGVRPRDEVEDILGRSAIGPSKGEGRIGSSDGKLYGPIVATKARYISDYWSNDSTLRGLVNGKGVGY